MRAGYRRLNYSRSIRAKRLPAIMQSGLRNEPGTDKSLPATGTMNRAGSDAGKYQQAGA
jgi:hypothetical protein